MKTYKFAVIGGDFRTIAASNKLSNLGHTVKVYGFDETSSFSNNIKISTSLSDVLADSEYIILPLPYTSGNGLITAPLYSRQIDINDIISETKSNQVIMAGKIDKLLAAILESKDISFFDYFDNEEFSVKNAVPTAEGAIEIALREIPVTLNQSNCLITGFGRISKLLSSLVKSFGAHVTIAARRHSDLAWVAATGYDGIYISELSSNIQKYNLVFNTVPHKIFSEDILKKADKDCLIIDLASKPGGVDFEVAQKLGLNVIWALSLPGKVAPLTAGEIITDTVLNIIKESEVK